MTDQSGLIHNSLVKVLCDGEGTNASWSALLALSYLLLLALSEEKTECSIHR